MTFSIFHLPGGHDRSTPLYDVLSVHPAVGHRENQIVPQRAKLAMAVRGNGNHYLADRIQRRHWIAQARQVDLGVDIAEVLPADFPCGLADSTLNGIEKQKARLATT